ncbi:MAG: hypothetical protein AB1650_02115 [Candidatus Omnitrophota bacterium]
MGIFSRKNPELNKFAQILAKSIVALFKERGDISFSEPPKLVLNQIIEYEGKMRANGIERYDGEVAYVSAVNFYASAIDLEKKKTLGALIVYVEKSYLPKLMKLLQYPPVDDEIEQSLLDSIGTLCNIVAGRFKSEVKSAGYADLEMSHFINYRNNATIGIEFCRSEYDYYEVDCYIEGVKRIAFDLTIGIVPKR